MKKSEVSKSLARSIARLASINEKLELAVEMNGGDPFNCRRCRQPVKECECTDDEMDEHFQRSN